MSMCSWVHHKATRCPGCLHEELGGDLYQLQFSNLPSSFSFHVPVCMPQELSSYGDGASRRVESSNLHTRDPLTLLEYQLIARLASSCPKSRRTPRRFLLLYVRPSKLRGFNPDNVLSTPPHQIEWCGHIYPCSSHSPSTTFLPATHTQPQQKCAACQIETRP